MAKSLVKINDDKGNPLNVNNDIVSTNGKTKGKSNSINPDTGTKYPEGFTPQVDFIVNPNNLDDNGVPIEMGYISVNNNLNSTPTNPNNKMKDRRADFDKQKDISGKSFIHSYDYMSDGTPKSIPENSKIRDINLGSFIETGNDNEDPTIFGFDVIIDVENSPLFNGAVEEFIMAFPNIEEVQSRLEIYNRFKELFFTIFKSNNPVSPSKAHYLKRIVGLDSLVESSQPDLYKGLVDYRKDTIRLSLYEDVSLTMGELAMLYKTLTWSRINGKLLIPENLLRFNVEIVISEIRKFNRFFKKVNDISSTLDNTNSIDNSNQTWSSSGIFDDAFTGMSSDTATEANQFFGGSNVSSINNDINRMMENQVNNTNSINMTINEVVDLMAKYRYQLYECKFYFPKMTHGDGIDMWNSGINSISDGTEIMFDYKFTTLKLEKFIWNIDTPNVRTIDNSKIDPLSISTSETNNSGINSDGTIVTGPNIYPVTYMKSWDFDPTQPNNDLSKVLNGSPDGPLDILKKEASKAGSSIVRNLLQKVKLAAVNEVNRQILSRARLLNKTIDTLRNRSGLGRMSEPTNVYSGSSLFQNDLKNAMRGFVGDSIKGIFKK